MSPRTNFIAKLIPGAKCIFTARWCPNPTERTVLQVRSKDASFSHPTKPNSEGSWLNYPKASEITEPAPGMFVISFADAPNNILTYDFNVPS